MCLVALLAAFAGLGQQLLDDGVHSVVAWLGGRVTVIYWAQADLALALLGGCAVLELVLEARLP